MVKSHRLHSALTLVVLLAAGLGFARPALAQATPWPERPVRLVIPFAAGATTDIVARLLANKLAERLGKPFVVDNRPGANAIVGTEIVANAPGDGYTMLMAGSSTHAINPNLFRKLPYDAEKQFTDAGYLGGVRYVLTVAANAPDRTVQDLVSRAKANPGKMNYGAGNSATVLGTELFKLVTGTDFTGLNYKSNAAAATDLMGGTLQIVLLDIGIATPLLKSGQLRALAFTGPKRSPAFPDVPIFAEIGYPDVSRVVGWIALWFPAGVQRPVVEKFNAALNYARESPDFAQRLADLGIFTDGPNTVDDFSKLVREDRARWARVVREAKIKQE